MNPTSSGDNPFSSETLLPFLNRVPVIARRFLLDTGDAEATVPMLRGVWGLALYDHGPEAYREVFQGGPTPSSRTPLYILRAGPLDPSGYPSLEFIVLGKGIAHDDQLLEAWEIACSLGLGPKRRRFRILRADCLDARERVVAGDGKRLAFNLALAPWPLEEDPVATPFDVVFELPLRILFHGKIVVRPALRDLVQAGFRRLAGFLPPEDMPELWRLQETALAAVDSVPQNPFEGRPADVVRYSARQESVVEMSGVTGGLSLPLGPGPHWRLLAAAQWMHLGKTTTLGLGKPVLRAFGSAKQR